MFSRINFSCLSTEGARCMRERTCSLPSKLTQRRRPAKVDNVYKTRKMKVILAIKRISEQ